MLRSKTLLLISIFLLCNQVISFSYIDPKNASPPVITRTITFFDRINTDVMKILPGEKTAFTQISEPLENFSTFRVFFYSKNPATESSIQLIQSPTATPTADQQNIISFDEIGHLGNYMEDHFEINLNFYLVEQFSKNNGSWISIKNNSSSDILVVIVYIHQSNCHPTCKTCDASGVCSVCANSEYSVSNLNNHICFCNHDPTNIKSCVINDYYSSICESAANYAPLKLEHNLYCHTEPTNGSILTIDPEKIWHVCTFGYIYSSENICIPAPTPCSTTTPFFDFEQITAKLNAVAYKLDNFISSLDKYAFKINFDQGNLNVSQYDIYYEVSLTDNTGKVENVKTPKKSTMYGNVPSLYLSEYEVHEFCDFFEPPDKFRCFVKMVVINRCSHEIVYYKFTDIFISFNESLMMEVKDVPMAPLEYDFDPCTDLDNCVLSADYKYDVRLCKNFGVAVCEPYTDVVAPGASITIQAEIMNRDGSPAEAKFFSILSVKAKLFNSNNSPVNVPERDLEVLNESQNGNIYKLLVKLSMTNLFYDNGAAVTGKVRLLIHISINEGIIRRLFDFRALADESKKVISGNTVEFYLDREDIRKYQDSKRTTEESVPLIAIIGAISGVLVIVIIGIIVYCIIQKKNNPTQKGRHVLHLQSTKHIVDYNNVAIETGGRQKYSTTTVDNASPDKKQVRIETEDVSPAKFKKSHFGNDDNETPRSGEIKIGK